MGNMNAIDSGKDSARQLLEIWQSPLLMSHSLPTSWDIHQCGVVSAPFALFLLIKHSRFFSMPAVEYGRMHLVFRFLTRALFSHGGGPLL